MKCVKDNCIHDVTFYCTGKDTANFTVEWSNLEIDAFIEKLNDSSKYVFIDNSLFKKSTIREMYIDSDCMDPEEK